MRIKGWPDVIKQGSGRWKCTLAATVAVLMSTICMRFDCNSIVDSIPNGADPMVDLILSSQ